MIKLQLLDNEEIPTKKIIMAPIMPLSFFWSSGSGIIENISQYGSIESMKTIYLNNLKYIAIEYKHSASVTVLLAKGKQNINGMMYEPIAVMGGFPRKMAHLLFDTYEKLTEIKNDNNYHTDPAPDQDLSSNIINQLNDDCLMEIFERVSLRDLCAIANTCKRFNGNVKKVFAARFTNIDVVWLKDDNLPNEPIPIILIASLFRNFGLYMKMVAINLNDIGEEYNDRVLSLMLRYCTAENCNLTGLKISSFQFHLNSMDEFRPIFGRLTQLSASEMSTQNLKRLLSMCKSLKYLQLEAIEFGRTHKQIFDHLEEIELICVRDLNNEKIDELFSMNKQIKRLVICDPFDQLSSITYKSMGNLSLLEHLEVEPAIRMREKDSEQNVLALARLKRLKVFRLNCLDMPINELLNSFVEKKISIDDMSLKSLVVDAENTKSISKMVDIRTLRLLEIRGPDVSHFIKMVKKMPHLQHLVFGGISSLLNMENVKELVKTTTGLSKFCLINQKNMVIDLDDYNEMLRWIKERDNSFRMDIKILGADLNMDVPENIVERNHHWLNVKLQNIDEDEDEEDEDEDEEDEEDEENEDEDEEDEYNEDEDEEDEEDFIGCSMCASIRRNFF